MENKIKNEIGKIVNPYTNKTDLLKMINFIDYDNETNKVIINAKSFGDDNEINREISRQIIKLLKIDMGILGVKMVNEKPLKEQYAYENVKVIAVVSAKGGVGKSNVALSIANILASQNKKVALVDADIIGYSIPKLTNNYEPVYVNDGKIIPNKLENGLEVMSAEYFLGEKRNKAIVWRANMFGSLLNKFFKETNYQDGLQYLIIDMPPGTSDTLLNLRNYFEDINSVVVTTPSSNAHYVSVRIIDVLKDLGHNIIGLINNMAYYEIDGQKHYVLGKEDVKGYCKENTINFLGDIPIKGEGKYFDKDYLTKYYNNIVEEILKYEN